MNIDLKRQIEALSEHIGYNPHEEDFYMSLEPVAYHMGFSGNWLLTRMLALSERINFKNIGANAGDLDSPQNWFLYIPASADTAATLHFSRSAMVLYASQRIVGAKNLIWQHARVCALVLAAFDLHRAKLRDRDQIDLSEIYVRYKDNEAVFLANQTSVLRL